ncbi:MAG: glycosyltransferase [Dysgonamonadaceae bacterium]|jgi:glycosyltransferase involved in cell wall biosynthesis|nr:glycosyltransferase [Dysgonamonadaceae bacterium]
MIFSIITVTRNAAQWIEKTIQSVLSQTCSNIEYIIIDGASTDKTIKIITDYELQIRSKCRFHWISEPDNGIYDAMNKGLKLATGDYVWFINAGDQIRHPTTIQTINSQFLSINSHFSILYGETEISDLHGNSLGMRRLKAPERLTWKNFKMGMLVCHQSFIVKREIAEPYDLQYRHAADFEWCIRCMKRAKHIFNTHQTLSYFLEAGYSAKNRKASLKERYMIMCKYYGKIPTQIRHLWFAVRFCFAKMNYRIASPLRMS